MADLGTFIGEFLLKCKAYGIAGTADQPAMNQWQLSIVGTDADMGVPVLKGDKGDAGTAASPFKWQFPELSSTTELPVNLGNTAADKGKAWVVHDGLGTADIAYWSGQKFEYIVDAFGPGLPGPTPRITATGEQVDEDAEFEIEITGSALSPNLHFKIPEVPGPAGVGSDWALFDKTIPRTAGMVPVWDAAAGKFLPGSAASVVPRVERFTQPESMFTAYSGSGASQLISTMVLPTRTYNYHVEVDGHVRVGAAPLNSARVAVEVRLDSATTGSLVAKGLGVTSGICVIGAHYSSAESDKTGYASAPGSATGRVAAGALNPTLFITARRDSGSGQWYSDKGDSQLSVKIIPDLS